MKEAESVNLFRTKPINSDAYCDTGLKRCLNATDLTLLGIGAIIGAGIFVLPGVAAATKAGPAIVLSYVVAGMACTFAARAYAELAASIGGCGSAYGYSYAGFGEIVAWLIGWDLILEYGIAPPTVAIGWSGYVNNALMAMGVHLPPALLSAPDGGGGIVNLPAALIILVLAALLAAGVHTSARFNAAMVLVKLIAIAVFIGVAVFNVNPTNWQPFMPFGWDGVMAGAALIFFAYIGFDAVSTAAEEAINPQSALSHSQRRLTGGRGAGESRPSLRVGIDLGRRHRRAHYRDAGTLLRPYPRVSRHGAGRPAAAGVRNRASRHADAGTHHPGERCVNGPGRRLPAHRYRGGTRQHRYARCVFPGLRGRDLPPLHPPRAAAPLSHAVQSGDSGAGYAVLRLFDVQLAGDYLVAIFRLARHRSRDLFCI